MERWFGELTEKKIKRAAHTSVQAFERDIRAWVVPWNEDPRPYVMGEDRRPDPRIAREILLTNWQLGTLVRSCIIERHGIDSIDEEARHPHRVVGG